MPISVTVDQDHRLIRVALNGAIADADLRELSAVVRADPALAVGYGVLYDCTGVTQVLVSSDMIMSLAIGGRQDRNRLAVVTRGRPAVIGLAHMYQTVSDADSRVQVFDDEASALAWLAAGGRVGRQPNLIGDHVLRRLRHYGAY